MNKAGLAAVIIIGLIIFVKMMPLVLIVLGIGAVGLFFYAMRKVNKNSDTEGKI